LDYGIESVHVTVDVAGNLSSHQRQMYGSVDVVRNSDVIKPYFL